MLAKIIVAASLALLGAATAALHSNVQLDRTSDLQVDQRAAVTPEALTADWGQFEFSIPKSSFPLPAPHCKGRIKLRLIALPPGAPRRDQIIAQRWILLQHLRDLESGEGAAIDLNLDLSHYATHRSDGSTALEYCNSFSNGEFTIHEH